MSLKTVYEVIGKDSISPAMLSAKKGVNDFERASKSAGETAASAFSRLAGPLLGAVSAVQGLQKLVEVSREFDVLNAGLITATGSAENAKTAFTALQQFATETPFDIQQVTESFTKLVNYGLDPSERAMTAYGNTASAMGKDLNQMVEAVADAATGEFERLKEFGIKAKKEGDDVQFTFRGVSTTVKNSSDEIQSYLIGLSENNFAGAMTQRMDSLDGALSNLSDSWNQLFLNVSQQGAGDIIATSVRFATGAINEMNSMLASGQMEGYLEAIAGKFSGLFGDIGEGWAGITGSMSKDFGNEMQLVEDIAGGSVDFLIGAFTELPENIRAMIQLLVVEFAHKFDLIGSEAEEFKDKIAAIFTDDTIDDAAQRGADRVAAMDQARTDSIASILAERDAALASYDDQIKKSDEARQKFDQTAAARTGDQLAPFKVAPPAGAQEEDQQAGPGKKSKFDPSTDPEVAAAQQRINYLKTLKDMDAASSKQSEELTHLNRIVDLKKRLHDGEIPTIEQYNDIKEQISQRHGESMARLEIGGATQRIAELSAINEAGIATALQKEELAYTSRLEILRKNFESGELPTLESYNRLKEAAHQKHLDAVAELAMKGEANLSDVDATRRSAIEGVMIERDAVLAGYDEQITKAEEARTKFEEANAARTGSAYMSAPDAMEATDPVTGEATASAPPAAPWTPEEDGEVLATQQRIAYLRTLKDAEAATDVESEQLAYLQRMEMLRQRFEDGEIPSLEAYNRLKEGVQAKHEENVTNLTVKGAAQRAAFMKKSFSEQASQTFSTLANITAGVAQHNKGMFELNKAMGIGTAIINTYKGVSESLAAYPMPLAAIMAAGHLAAGLSQVSAIKSQTFGNSSAGSTAIGGAPVTTAPSNIALMNQPQQPQQPAPAPQTNVYVNIEDEGMYSGRTVRKLMEEINRQQTSLNVRYG